MMKKKVDLSKRAPDYRDKLVGKRIKQYREISGLSQSELGDFVGVTFQQIQKYEHGTNKISVGRLYDICSALNISVNTFLRNLIDNDISKVTPSNQSFVSDNTQDTFEADPLASKETRELLKVYYSVTDPKKRKSIVKFIKDNFS